MGNQNNQNSEEVKKTISQDRKRTNILHTPEQNAIAFLVQRIPSWVSSNMLTAFGLVGNIIVACGFAIAAYFGRIYLLICLVGFLINWFGDSLDGRLAYYRNTPRKWFGFSLDLVVDWIGICFMGLGVILYIDDRWELLGYAFVVLYGWEILIAMLRYKISDKYSIDSGLLGPTEVRVLISIFIVAEIFFAGAILLFAAAACILLLISSSIETRKVLAIANERDGDEKIKKAAENKKSL